MKTGGHLKIESMGTKVLGVRLFGDPARPEPEHFRICFPGGEIEVVRCDDGSHWAHVHVNHAEALSRDQFKPYGEFVDGRVDELTGVIDLPKCDHVALRIKAAPDAEAA